MTTPTPTSYGDNGISILNPAPASGTGGALLLNNDQALSNAIDTCPKRKGNYSATVAYLPGDIVLCNDGNYYVCDYPSTNENPLTAIPGYWTMLQAYLPIEGGGTINGNVTAGNITGGGFALSGTGANYSVGAGNAIELNGGTIQDTYGGSHNIYNAGTFYGTFSGSLTGNIAESQVTGLSNSLAAKVSNTAYYGTIYNKSTWSNLNDFATSNVTLGLNGSNQLVFGGSSPVFTQTAAITAYSTRLPKWRASITVVIGTVNTSSYGLAIGLLSTNNGGNKIGCLGQMSFYSSNGTSGTIGLSLYSTNPASSIFTNVAIISSSIAFNTGDTVQLAVERDEDVLTATVYNLTQELLPATISYQFSVAYGATNLLPNVGNFCLYSLGGTNTITNITITSKAITNADLAIVGDSKAVGYYAGNYGQSYSSLLGNNFRSVTMAGGSDGTREVLAALPELIALNPKTVLLNIGRNDLQPIDNAFSTGVTYTQLQTNYASIVSQLTAAGIQVIHLLPLWENIAAGGYQVNQATFTAWIKSQYSNYIDPMGVNESATASNIVAPDGIHPNQFFHSLIYKACLEGLGAQNPKHIPYLLKNLANAPQSTTGTVTGYTDSGSTAIHLAGTYTGNLGTTAYTISDVVYALKQLGLLAL